MLKIVVRLLVGALAVLAVAVVSASGGSGHGARRVRPLPSPVCEPIQYRAPGSPRYLIASDLPLQGPGSTQTAEMTKAIHFALYTHGYKAGRYRVGYQSCDDSTARTGRWDAARCAANGNAYARNRDVILVIGTFDSGCASIQIPIANRAPNGPLGMISPANTYVGLTHRGPGTAPGEPGSYFPTGKRNYVRIVAAADLQAAADALLAKQLGIRKVYVLNDREAYGVGAATNFRNAARRVGVRVAGFAAWDGRRASYRALAARIRRTKASGVFLGGLVGNNGGRLIKDLRAGLGARVRILAPDGFTPVSAVVRAAGKAAEGMTVSAAGLPNRQLRGAGRTFFETFGKLIGKSPDPYSAYAAQAAEIGLAAIAASNGTRASVTAKLLRTRVRNGILGTFSIDRNGDTTVNPVTIYRVKGGKSTFDRVIVPAPNLVKPRSGRG